MFTGIIEEKGMISRIMKTASQAILTIKAKKFIFNHMKNLYNPGAIFFDTLLTARYCHA